MPLREVPLAQMSKKHVAEGDGARTADDAVTAGAGRGALAAAAAAVSAADAAPPLGDYPFGAIAFCAATDSEEEYSDTEKGAGPDADAATHDSDAADEEFDYSGDGELDARASRLPGRATMRWDALILLRELCRTGRAAAVAHGPGGAAAAAAAPWLCGAAPNWAFMQVCGLLRGGLDTELIDDAVAARGLYGAPAGVSWATDAQTSSERELFGRAGATAVALPKDGLAVINFTMIPRFQGPAEFETHLARARVSFAPCALRLYGPLTAAQVLIAISAAVRREEHRNVFLLCNMLLPKHGGTYARYTAVPRRSLRNAYRFPGSAPPISTAPLPDPTEGLGLRAMIALARRTLRELWVAMDPHGPGCRREDCTPAADEIPSDSGPCYDLERVGQCTDGSWTLLWGANYI
jgi:hypothetical protein